jgi:hypothetical protein
VLQDFAIITYDTVASARKAINVLDNTKLPSGATLSLQFTSLMPDTPAKTTDAPWNPALSPSGAPGGLGLYVPGAPAHSAFATGLATLPRGSFTGDGGPTGGLGSGSLFPVGRPCVAVELFGGPLGGSMGGLGSFGGGGGGLGSLGSGLRVGGAGSPAFGKPPRDGGGPTGFTGVSSSSLYSTTPIRAGSPGEVPTGGSGPGSALGGGGGGRGGLGVQGLGLPPMYTGTAAGMSNSGSAGNLFSRAVGGDGGSKGPAGGSSGSDGGSAHGGDADGV